VTCSALLGSCCCCVVIADRSISPACGAARLSDGRNRPRIIEHKSATARGGGRHLAAFTQRRQRATHVGDDFTLQ